MKKLLLATAAVLGLVISAGGANATLTYTIWNDATAPGTLLNFRNATFPVPGVSLFANFIDPGNPINFNNPAVEGPNTFANFFTAPVLAECNAATSGACGGRTMSTLGDQVTTFIRITETYNTTNPALLAGSIDHDDGGTVWVNGNFTTGAGAIQICGNPNEANENTEACAFPAGLNTLAVLYTEDNGSPAILHAIIPPETNVPEPASLALLGSALLGFGVFKRRRSS